MPWLLLTLLPQGKLPHQSDSQPHIWPTGTTNTKVHPGGDQRCWLLSDSSYRDTHLYCALTEGNLQLLWTGTHSIMVIPQKWHWSLWGKFYSSLHCQKQSWRSMEPLGMGVVHRQMSYIEAQLCPRSCCSCPASMSPLKNKKMHMLTLISSLFSHF